MKLFYTCLICLFVLPYSSSHAQIIKGIEKRDRERKKGSPWGHNRRDAIYSHSQSNYRPFGWYINPGLTYMIGNSSQDQSDAYDLRPSGLPGYYVEGGLALLMKRINKVAHYVDFGLGVKHFGGQEKVLYDSGDNYQGQFNFGAAFARVGIHNCWQISMYNFIDQSIGLNVDYTIYGGNQDQDYMPPQGYDNQGKLVAQLNYSIGWGIKMRDGFYIIPTLQTPILTGYEFTGFNPGHRWFNSRYQPTIFTVKLGWLFPKKGCPKVYDNGEGKNSQEQFQMR